MKTVNLHQAKTHLSRLVEEAAAGEEIVIAKAGRPMVRLVPVSSPDAPREMGWLAGQVWEAEDCWDPDPQLERLFYGEDDDADDGSGGSSSER